MQLIFKHATKEYAYAHARSIEFMLKLIMNHSEATVVAGIPKRKHCCVSKRSQFRLGSAFAHPNPPPNNWRLRSVHVREFTTCVRIKARVFCAHNMMHTRASERDCTRPSDRKVCLCVDDRERERNGQNGIPVKYSYNPYNAAICGGRCTSAPTPPT